MKLLRKISAILCIIALLVSSIVYYPKNAKAVSYDSLTYTTLSGDVSYSKLSDGIEGMSPVSPELLDGGATLLFAFAATNENVTLSLNGEIVTTSDERVTELSNNIAKLNPQKFAENSYTLITITSSKGTSEYVVKKGKPASGGQIPTVNQGGDTTQGGQTTPAQIQTTTPQTASSLPKKLAGLVAVNESGTDMIENATMFAWAGADNKDNVDGYDPTVTATALYIYKNGTLVTKIGNATNGGIVGGLSAGTYTAKAANVNSMGEGPMSEEVTFTITGTTLDYKYPANCIGPKSPNGLSYITGNPEVPADNPAQADNKLGVAWAPSSEPSIPSYDASVVGYNLYLFDAETGKPYRRAYVDGASTSNIILESVSAGEYIACLSTVNAAGEESAMAATSFGLASKVTVKGIKIDNAQSFDAPNQPTLPIGLTIITEGIQYGFTVAWSSDADFSGQKLNLFVDGVCIKSGINSGVASYYENRLAAGTYTVEIKAQYIDNDVESFGLSKTISIAADPGLDTKTPAELADPTYKPYDGSNEPVTGEDEPDTGEATSNDDEPTSSDKPIGGDKPTNGDKPTSGNAPTEKDTPTSSQTTPEAVKPTNKSDDSITTTTAPNSAVNDNSTKTVKVGKVTIKSASKKNNAKKANIKIKKVAGATKYKIQISKTKKFKKILVKKTVKTVSAKVSSKKIKNAKKLFVRVKAIKVVSGKTYEGKWSKTKRITIKK